MPEYPIALITDSTSDLPQTLLDQYAIEVVPLIITWGDDQLRDRVDIDPQAFYERLVTDPVHPKTSQPAPGDFANAVRNVQARGAREAVILTISSGMSSTHHSAVQGVSGLDLPVHVFDSKANSLSLGWQVLAAARARESGGDAQAMLDAAESVRGRVVTRLYVDTLEYLHRGGRIGRARKWIGTALNLKPLLQVDHTTGTIEPRARARSQSQALDRMIADFFAQVGPERPLRVGLLHGNVPDEVEVLADRIRAEYAPDELLIGLTSPVMGVHTGPGAMALCGYAGA